MTQPLSSGVRTRVRTMLALSISGVLSGCLLGPDYARPQVDLPERFNAQTSVTARLEVPLRAPMRAAAEASLMISSARTVWRSSVLLAPTARPLIQAQPPRTDSSAKTSAATIRLASAANTVRLQAPSTLTTLADPVSTLTDLLWNQAVAIRVSHLESTADKQRH